jgi:hypothetical protein
MNDTPTGHDRAPDRYTGQGRETIDRMRDLAWATGLNPDEVFGFFCLATALKYHDRAGLKGDADEDLAKMRWYRAMALHALTGRHPDPRADRPGFVPYSPLPLTPDLLEWLDEEFDAAPVGAGGGDR